MMVNNLYENPNWFTDQLTLYQAANTSNAAIKRNFMIRIAEFELIIADLRSKKAKDPLQHELILGRRGSGKSTLLKRIQVEIEEDKDLANKYIAINLAEEQAGIYRLSDLWFEVLQELMLRFDAQKALRDFTTFTESEDYSRYLYAEIHALLVKNKRKVVLLLDNLDRILENFNDDGHLLRETLLNYNDLQIIGGSKRMDEHFWQYDKPFYEFFRRHRLEGLQFEEMHELLNHWSNIMQLPQLTNYALCHRGKVEAIRILTDGLPRAMQFFIEILLHDSTLYGFDYLRKVMDRATPLYQERLNSLTPPQRKIILEMAFWWEACPTKVLVEKCRMEGKTISSFLKQLENFGIVETLKTGNKNHLYRVSERFFNMWLIITQGNPAQKRHAKYLTYFIEAWYDAAELKNLTSLHIEGLKSGKLSFDKAMVLSKAFSQSKFISLEQRDDLILLTQKLDEGNVYGLELPRTYAEISKEIKKLEAEEKYDELLEKIEEIENEEDGLKFYIKAACFQKQKKYVEAEEFYLKAIEKEYSEALNNLANVYSDENRFVEAEKFYLKAIEKQSVRALYNIANLYKEQEKYDKAEQYYLKAIETGFFVAFNNLANLNVKQEKYDKAEKFFLKAIETGNLKALNNLANLYSIQKKYDKAEEYYFKAIEIKDIRSLFNLAILYKEQGKYDKTREFYLKAIEKGHVEALNNLSTLLYAINEDKTEALSYIRQFYEHKTGKYIYRNPLIIEIWNGIFENVNEKIEAILKESAYENLALFITELLNQGQIHLVLSLFESEQHGEALKSRYELLQYATLILAGKTEGNLLLKIPPEVMPTVQEIVEKVKEKQAFYGV
jgi:TPR repeat protein